MLHRYWVMHTFLQIYSHYIYPPCEQICTCVIVFLKAPSSPVVQLQLAQLLTMAVQNKSELSLCLRSDKENSKD